MFVTFLLFKHFLLLHFVWQDVIPEKELSMRVVMTQFRVFSKLQLANEGRKFTFEKMLKTNNLIFSSGIDLIHEFFNVERKTKNTLLSKTIQYLGKNQSINYVLKKIADKGVIL